MQSAKQDAFEHVLLFDQSVQLLQIGLVAFAVDFDDGLQVVQILWIELALVIGGRFGVLQYLVDYSLDELFLYFADVFDLVFVQFPVHSGLPHFHQILELVQNVPGLVDDIFGLVAVVDEAINELEAQREHLLSPGIFIRFLVFEFALTFQHEVVRLQHLQDQFVEPQVSDQQLSVHINVALSHNRSGVVVEDLGLLGVL